MEYEDRKTNPTKLIIFILIGGALVVLSELFIFGGIKNVMNSNNNDDLLDVASLRQQHSLYMDDGVYIDPSMLVRFDQPAKKLKNVSQVASADEMPITIDDILSSQKAAELSSMELANIMPAVGVEQNIIPDDIIDEQEDAFMKVLSEVNAVVEAQIIPEINSAELFADAALDNLDILVTYEYDEPKGSGMIAIIIDDMGVSLRSKLVEVLPAPLTLSYLPYAKNLKERTARASKNGHELMVHVPMEAMKAYMDGGPKVLKSSLSETEFMNILDWGLAQFDGFVGINNHMGSRLTQDEDAMKRVMNYLKARDSGLFFIDSKTIGSSVAASTAHSLGVAYAERDVFLDHEINKEFIEGALAKLEAVANKKGYAIAIGHPHKETIAALKEWLPTLEAKGLTLVPASKLIKHPIAVNDNLVAVGR